MAGASLLAQRIVVRLRTEVYDKLQRLSFRFLDTHESGSIINRVTGDVQAVRLFIDGVNAIRDGATRPDRLSAFMTALSNELRALNVTTAISGEMHPILGQSVDVPLPGVSPLVENTILLRYVEDGARLCDRERAAVDVGVDGREELFVGERIELPRGDAARVRVAVAACFGRQRMEREVGRREAR